MIHRRAATTGLLAALLGTTPAQAYVGPGAGLAVAGGVWSLAVVLLAVVAIFVFPVHLAWHGWRDRRRRRRARARRVIVVGFDGLDPRLLDRFLADGLLPHFQWLAGEGSCTDLRTVLPAITPAAWSSFATGVDPSRHGIFDFVGRDPRTYLPRLATAEVRQEFRDLRLGPWRRRVARSRIASRRRSRAFWQVLSSARVFNTLLRLPVTWPPERVRGVLLSGLSAPDLRGTQGQGTVLTTAAIDADAPGPLRVPLREEEGRLCGRLPGPVHPLEPGAAPLWVDLALVVTPGGARLSIGDQTVDLVPGVDSAWLPLAFGPVSRPLRGLVRARLLRRAPPALYLTPLQIDPERPVMPVSHPGPFARYLARSLGPYATVGLAEDTDALNSGDLDEQGFLSQADSLHAEREAILLHCLERAPEGLVACVFDGTDRVQHMFYHTLDADHPVRRHRPCAVPDAVARVYRAADETVGRVRARLRDDDVLLVLSDHGFAPFRRGVDLNAWLRDAGYLHLRAGARRGGPWLADVDWGRTRAYALGLSGLYVNLQGRERDGSVAPAQCAALKAQLAAALTGLTDGEAGRVAIERAYVTDVHYGGPYVDDGPDLLVGYAEGYRVSWGAARGEVGDRVFADNDRPWSGDHCVEPSLVPGVLLANRRLHAGAAPRITDVPVTILRLLGVEPPAYMKGRDLLGPAGAAT